MIPRLDKISTSWTLLGQAHGPPGDTAAAARALLVKRYTGAARRYLGAVLRDDDAADDLTQEFALALVEGKVAKAKRGGGRFRDYVKAVLLHLVSRHRKKQQRQPRQAEVESEASAGPKDEERAFVESWREELLARTWEALNEAQPNFFTVLHFRAVHPKMASPEMAQQVGVQIGKTLSPEAVRQLLHRARTLFAELLLVEVAQSLTEPSRQDLERELSELNLLTYCQDALSRQLGQ